MDIDIYIYIFKYRINKYPKYIYINVFTICMYETFAPVDLYIDHHCNTVGLLGFRYVCAATMAWLASSWSEICFRAYWKQASFSSWWLSHPFEKHDRQNRNLPQIGVKIQNT